MIERSLAHESRPPEAADRSPNLAALDALLNDFILTARTDAEQAAAWRLKVSIKRALQDVPDAGLDEEAGRILRALASEAA